MSSPTPAVEAPLATRAGVPPAWPADFPAWAKELADLYYTGTTCLFILHGNVHDLVACPAQEGSRKFVTAADFLATHLFGSWDVVMDYDLGSGFRPLVGGDAKRLQTMQQLLMRQLGPPAAWSRDPDKVLDQVDQLVERALIEDDPALPRRMAFLFEHAEYLLPAADLSTLARGQAARLVRCMGWAQNPYIKRQNMAFCLITEKLSEINDRLVQDPHVATIEIPMPDAAARRTFIEHTIAADPRIKLGELTVEAVTQLSSGLNLVSLNVLLAQSGPQGLELGPFRKLKKAMIERHCQGLVEFIEPPHTLDLIVGHAAGTARLKQDSEWIARGQLDTAPMGYLICGSVGTGKTFLAECYAGSIGVPCVKLLNFRSKYVGETEGNLEQVLNVLRALGPVIVIIDEADAALGNREADGDSGTSGRVFSMIASQMGDTRYRGKIVWMLLTCRPDLLPIDLKRQGRCEVHIPLFPPQTEAEIADMWRVMAKKNKTALAADALPTVSPARQLSGADLESILLGARRRALLAGRAAIEKSDFVEALDDFIPSAEGLEKELQETVAVLECTDRGFLTAAWRERIAQLDGRAKLQQRVSELRGLL
ncbi:MAG TPA: AAA family ATPase [Pirellulales bacterium]|jgi:AAA+ superfamily predicted ATPase|nr:AAA family ATPase [Pirellulales bacterium]